MSEIKSFPNNQDEYYGAEDVMKWLHGRTSGVFAAAENAAVAAVQNAMAVTVSDGIGWMSNSENNGVVWWNDKEASGGSKLQLSIDAAHSTLDRIDRIIVEWATVDYSDKPEIKVLKGTASSTATAPALTNNNLVRQISLAKISIKSGTTSITAQMITDERLDGTVCGLVSESISIDTTTMNAQFQAFLAGIARELDELEAGTGVELKHLQFSNISVPVSGWGTYTASGTEETALYADGYTYRTAIVLSGATDSMTPDVTPGISVDNCGATIWRAAQSYNGGIYLYADAVPSSAFTLININMWKAGVS